MMLSEHVNPSSVHSNLSCSNESRRFSGVANLYGEHALNIFRQSHVAVIGLGGVGSWVAEALARSGVGQLTLIDLDNVAISNMNRQIHALENTLGLPKVEAMKQRIQLIDPNCQVNMVEDFVEAEAIDRYLNHPFDFIVDAIDQVKTKVALIARCQKHQQAMITIGGAGGKMDPTQIEITDLINTIQDPLLAKVRSELRKKYGFPKEKKKTFKVPAVYSKEPLTYPAHFKQTGEISSGLNCAGFGSSVCVTATFGLVAVSYVLKQLAQKL